MDNVPTKTPENPQSNSSGTGSSFMPRFGPMMYRGSCGDNNGHEWRVIENFSTDITRTKRNYAAYCIYCLFSKTVEIEINNNSNNK